MARDSIYFTKISGKATGLLCFRKTVANASGLNRLVSYESAADDGLYIGITAADVVGVYAGDGTTVTAVAAATYSTSDIEVVGFGVNDGSLYGYQHGTGYSAATALSGITADPTFGVGRIGCQAFAVDNAEDFDLYDYIVIPDVYLEEWEADTLAAHLKTGDF
ncbi:MAG: hypothetical protein GY937_04720 [bacterium]|nr:hypothetical protein [bacterium]